MRARYTAPHRRSTGAYAPPDAKIVRLRRGAGEGRRGALPVDGGPMNARRSLPALAVVLAAAGAALAIDHPIAGDSLTLRDPMSAMARRLRFKAVHDTAVDPRQAGDPRALG